MPIRAVVTPANRELWMRIAELCKSDNLKIGFHTAVRANGADNMITIDVPRGPVTSTKILKTRKARQ